MATAPVGIAPVFTPQTFARLAEWAETSEQAQLASALRENIPFVSSMVEKQFRPLTAIRTLTNFNRRFELYALRFEPFRLYLNAKILKSIDSRNALSLYMSALEQVFGPLSKAAEATGFSSTLLQAVLRDYVFIFKVLSQVSTPSLHGMEFDRFELSINWMHSATKLDYGLTAIFLALERTLEFSRATIRVALMAASQAAVVEFATASSRFFGIPSDQLSRNSLSSTRFIADIYENREEFSTPSAPKLATMSRRTVELEWLKHNIPANAYYRGKWVVLEQNELVAVDTSYDKARSMAKQKGIKRPFIIFIPPVEQSGFMGI
jgi:hypothetical protein